MLGPSHGIEHGPCLIRLSGGCKGFVNFNQISLCCTSDVGNRIQIVTGIKLLHQLINASWMLKGHILFRDSFFISFKDPGGFIVGPLFRIVAGEEAIFEIKFFADDEWSVGIIKDIVLKD